MLQQPAPSGDGRYAHRTLRAGRAIGVSLDHLGEIPEALDRAAAVPGRHLAVDRGDTCAPGRSASTSGMCFSRKRKGSLREQDAVDCRRSRAAGRPRVALGRALGHRVPADERQRARDVGVAARRSSRGRARSGRGRLATAGSRPAISRVAPRRTTRTAARPRPPGRRSRRAAGRASRLSSGPSGWVTTTDGHERAQLLDRLEPVLVDVDDDVRRRELADPVDLHVLRAPDLRDRRDGLPRVDAEAGAPDELPGEPEVAEELGDARDEADDAGVGAGRRVRRDAGIASRADGARVRRSHVAPVLAADVVEGGGDLAERRDLDRLHQLVEDVAARARDLAAAARARPARASA